MTRVDTTVEALVLQLDSDFFAALAEPVRVSIVRELLLLGGPADINTITERLPQDRSGVSRHLKLMLDAGIVSCEKVGRHKYYQLEGGAILQRFEGLLDATRAAMTSCCPWVGDE